MRKKKGFTLIELIIVLAIMGILLAILIPSWGFYMQRARIRTQNNKAKVIFNAAQTVVTEMQMTERKIINEYNESNTSRRAELVKMMYTHNPSGVPSKPNPNEWFFYYDGSSGKRVSAGGGAISSGDKDTKDVSLGYSSDYVSAVGSSDWNEKLVREVNKILDDSQIVYKIYVRDYKVQSVVSGRFEKDRFIGAYPMNLDKLDDLGADIDKIKGEHIRTAVMTNFDLDTTDIKADET